MTKRRKALEDRAQWLRGYLKTHLEECQIPESGRVLSVQKNPPVVELMDEIEAPKTYQQKMVVLQIDMAELPAGCKIAGVLVREGNHHATD